MFSLHRLKRMTTANKKLSHPEPSDQTSRDTVAATQQKKQFLRMRSRPLYKTGRIAPRLPWVTMVLVITHIKQMTDKVFINNSM